MNKILRIILTSCQVGGTIGAGVLGYFGGKKVQKTLNLQDLSKKEEMKLKIKATAPAVALGVVSVASSVILGINNEQLENSVLLLGTAIDDASLRIDKLKCKYNKYRKKNIEKNGKEADENIVKEMADEDVSEILENTDIADIIDLTKDYYNYNEEVYRGFGELPDGEFYIHEPVCDAYIKTTATKFYKSLLWLNTFTFNNVMSNLKDWYKAIGVPEKDIPSIAALNVFCLDYVSDSYDMTYLRADVESESKATYNGLKVYNMNWFSDPLDLRDKSTVNTLSCYGYIDNKRYMM